MENIHSLQDRRLATVINHDLAIANQWQCTPVIRTNCCEGT
jgi:hypothetical protein